MLMIKSIPAEKIIISHFLRYPEQENILYNMTFKSHIHKKILNIVKKSKNEDLKVSLIAYVLSKFRDKNEIDDIISIYLLSYKKEDLEISKKILSKKTLKISNNYYFL